MSPRIGPKILLLLWTSLVFPRGRALCQDQPATAFWTEFNYTILSREKFVWLVSPSYRSDEQEVNGRSVSRLTTDGIVILPKDWEVRGRFS